MNFLNELRYTLKILMKNYWYTLLCCSVLAVGVGVMLPLYVLVENLQYKTPDFPEGKSYVAFIKNRAPVSTFDAFHYRYLQENAASFSELYAWQNVNYTISDGDYAEVVRSAAVEPQLLQVPQTQPLRGRVFTDTDEQVGASPVAIISYDLWQSYYAAREDIIGHSSRINGEARTIIGVMPPGFRFPLMQDLWLPLSVPATVNVAEGPQNLLIVGKLQPGTALKQASDEVSLLQASLLARWPEQYRLVTSAEVVPYVQVVSGSGIGASTLAVIFGSLLLLVAFNIGNLFLARGEERQAELSIRGALGASPARIGLTLLLESLVVCCCGLVLGWLLSYFALAEMNNHYLSGALNHEDYRATSLFWWDMTLNRRMLALSALAVLGIWLVSGGLPAWRLSRGNPGEALASGTKGHGDKGISRLSKVLVNMQLVFGSALLTLCTVQTLAYYSSTTTTTPNAEQLYRGTLDFGGTKLLTHAQQQQYLASLERSLLAEQGVEQVTFTSSPPGNEGTVQFYNLEEQDLQVNASYPVTWVLAVSANYFRVLDINLLEGRDFNAGDTLAAEPVVIIDQRLATRHWRSASALGKRLQINPQVDSTWYTVIGVSSPVVQEDSLDIGGQGRPVIYRPVSQAIPELMRALVRVTSTDLTPAALFRAAAAKVDRDMPIFETLTLREQEIRNDENEQFTNGILATFVIVSLYMTGIATYGLAARLTGRRRIETGIRMAMGASRRAALLVFIKDGLKTVTAGLTVGSIFAIGMTYSILQSGNGFAALNWLITITFLVAAFLGVLVMLANYFPARKLIDMEPADALRHE